MAEKNFCMKRILCICLILAMVMTVQAQYPLIGAEYIQDFDTLSSGLPEGWQVEIKASAVKRGIAAKFTAIPGAATRWAHAGGSFKNMASANGFAAFSAATAVLQQAAMDRALGLRQTGTFGDPGAAFLFRMDHTYQLHDFKLELQLQSLDTAAGRKTTWLLQYGIGDVPDTFITVASGTTGSSYANHSLRASFGKALDNHPVPVYIRLVTLSPAAGTGVRGVAAIDDVQLHWTGTAMPPAAPVPVAYYPVPATNTAAHGSILSIRFNRYISTGASGNYFITDETDHSLQTFPAAAAVAEGQILKLAGVLLRPGHSYHVTYDSLVADTAGFYVPALTDTTIWRFTAESFVPASIAQDFDTACSNGHQLPAGWSRYSMSGAQQWHCENKGTGSSFGIYGYDSSGFVSNEDWLLSPLLDLSDAGISGIRFSRWDSGAGPQADVLLSADYAGSGTPDAVPWLTLPLIAPSGIAGWKSCIVPISATDRIQPVHLAFRYRSDSLSGLKIFLDSLTTLISANLIQTAPAAYELRVAGIPGSESIDLEARIPQDGAYTAVLTTVTGQIIRQQCYRLTAGMQWLHLDQLRIGPGLYLISMTGPGGTDNIKCMIR